MTRSNSNVISKGWLKDSWSLTKPFWVSSIKYKAIFLLIVTIACSFTQVGVSVYLNKLNAKLFNAIQDYDEAEYLRILFQLIYIIAALVVIMVLKYCSNVILEIKWRKWLTNFYLDSWFKNKAYYNSRFSKDYTDNPDQRISEDIREFINLTMGLFLGILTSTTSLISFSVILWGLSGNLTAQRKSRELAPEMNSIKG
jgi:putative ATP-binding cassette transporter